MPQDDRNTLDVLKAELNFVKKGGYGRSPREPWRAQLVFEDSPTCMNYDTQGKSGSLRGMLINAICACRQAWREGSVPPHSPDIRRRHFASLVSRGDGTGDRRGAGHLVGERDCEVGERGNTRLAFGLAQPKHGGTKAWCSAATSSSKERRPAMVLNLRPKCANPSCAASFDWLAGGKLFRFPREHHGACSGLMEGTSVRTAHTRSDISGSASGARTSTRSITSLAGES